MKLSLVYKCRDLKFVETDFFYLDKKEFIYYLGEKRNVEYLEEIETLELDGKIIYRDKEIALDIKGVTKTLMTINEIINEGIKEYLKEKENAK